MFAVSVHKPTVARKYDLRTTSDCRELADNLTLGPRERGQAESECALARAHRLMGTRLATYFLGVISAGRYREISIPAATWHMLGFVQFFFMTFSC